MPDRAAYATAKGGVASLTRSLAVDYGKHKIRANAIAPSVTLTERIKRRFESNSKVRAYIEQLLSRHLLGAAEPLDVAQAALYLASDESRLITGQVLRVDSGMTIT
jgi:NAD(P)-dependent dehydrogenase (short-subunit alcohol dehydrogenase family)